MIPKETEAEILRLYHAEKWLIGTIAEQLGLHHTTVQRVLRQTDVEPKALATHSPRSSSSSSRSIHASARVVCSRWSKRAAIPAAQITSGASSASTVHASQQRHFND